MKKTIIILIGAALGVALNLLNLWSWVEAAIGLATLTVAFLSLRESLQNEALEKRAIQIRFVQNGEVILSPDFGLTGGSFSRAEVLGRLGMFFGGKRVNISYLSEVQIFAALRAVELGYSNVFDIELTQTERQDLGL